MAQSKRQIQDKDDTISWRFDAVLIEENLETSHLCTECYGVGEIYLETGFSVLAIPCTACNS